jgi:hypothetical protein
MAILDQLTTVEKLVAIVAAASLAYTTYVANTSSTKIAEQGAALLAQRSQLDDIGRRQDIEISLRKDSREAKQQQSELAHKVFQEFVLAVTEKNSTEVARIDRLGAVLVLTMVLPDPQQQEAMARVVQHAIDRVKTTDPALLARVDETKFDAEEVVLHAAEKLPPVRPQPASGAAQTAWNGYDFDVFWCSGQPNSNIWRQSAEDIAALGTKDPRSGGRWRVRELPANVNARPGYSIKQNEIRVSSADERPIADALKSLLQSKGVFKIRSTTKDTRGYLSVFVCTG